MTPSTSDPQYIFVYGTLRTAYSQLPCSIQNITPPHILQTANRWQGVAKLSGFQLYDLGSYPGVTPVKTSDSSSAIVMGDVFSVDESELPLLDEYEMMDPAYEKPYEYRRIPIQVNLMRPRQVEPDPILVWLYVFNWPILPNHILIEDGDYVSYYTRLLVHGKKLDD